MKVNLFFKKVYERKSLVWRCWMSRSGYGIVRIFKQKFFPKLFGFIKELSDEVYMIHEESSTLDVDLKMKVDVKMIIRNAEMILFIRNCVYLRIPSLKGVPIWDPPFALFVGTICELSMVQ